MPQQIGVAPVDPGRAVSCSPSGCRIGHPTHLRSGARGTRVAAETAAPVRRRPPGRAGPAGIKIVDRYRLRAGSNDPRSGECRTPGTAESAEVGRVRAPAAPARQTRSDAALDCFDSLASKLGTAQDAD